MKRTWSFSLIAVVLLALAIMSQNLLAQEDDAPKDRVQRTVTVSGQGQVAMRPDIARINLGVNNQARSAAEALAENSQNMDALISLLKDRGIADEDIRTSSLSLQPRYDYNNSLANNAPRLAGYDANNSVSIIVRDLADVGELLDDAVQAGATTINGLSFDVSNPEAALVQARELAVADARAKAEQLASHTGARLGMVMTISEGSSASPVTPFDGRMMAMESASAVPIESGSQELGVSVQVTWLLE